MPHPFPMSSLPAVAAVAAAVGWAFAPTLGWLADKWSSDPQYSHGFLVPLFSAYLVRRAAADGRLGGTPRQAAGAAVLAAAAAARWVGGKLMFHQLDAVALLLTLCGLAVWCGGWRLARGLAPAVGFLVFMLPLPHDWERNVGGPLKAVATWGSTALLQTLGYPAIAEGNLILIDEVRLGVADACSGLKMLVTFAAFAGGAVVLADRTRFEKLMVAAGVVPIALAVNVLRVAGTGVGHTLTADDRARALVHDALGWLMMPAGLGLLGLQLWCLTRLVERPPADVLPLRAAGRPAVRFA